jgi:hypothetical protein
MMQKSELRYVCIFHEDFLPSPAMRRIRELCLLDSNEAANYSMNNKQQGELGMVFRKMMDEMQSDYVFSKELQKTYLVEIIHFIVKNKGAI